MLEIRAAASFYQPAGETPATLGPILVETCGKRLRRVSRFIELAVIGAQRCITAGGVPLREDTAVYLATGQGSVADTAQLQERLVARSQPPMPFVFINASSNMAGFYIAQLLDIIGPNLTVSSHDVAFEAALELTSLGDDPGVSILIGAVDEAAWPLADQRRRLHLPPDTPLGEGSHWLWIERGSAAPRAAIRWIRRFHDGPEMLAFIRSERLSGDVFAARGSGLPEGEFHSILSATAIERRYDYLEQVAWHDTQTAFGLCRFIETQAQASLLHVNRNDRGQFYALLLDAF